MMPCFVNGLKLRFIFDTGASNVSISLTEAIFMVKNDYLSEEDLLNIEYYRFANGDIGKGTKVILRQISIGSLILKNVEASVVHELDAPLLLGQSALSRLGKIQFDYSNNTLTVLDGSNEYIDDNYKPSESIPSSTNSDNQTTNSSPCNPGEIKVKKATGIYNDQLKFMYYVPRNTCVKLISIYTTNADYYYVQYLGIKGYILKIAF